MNITGQLGILKFFSFFLDKIKSYDFGNEIKKLQEANFSKIINPKFQQHTICRFKIIRIYIYDKYYVHNYNGVILLFVLFTFVSHQPNHPCRFPRHQIGRRSQPRLPPDAFWQLPTRPHVFYATLSADFETKPDNE